MNITFVSALYNIYNDNKVSDRLTKDVLKLLGSNLNLIIYVDSFFFNVIKDISYKDNIIIIKCPLTKISIYSNIIKQKNKLTLPSMRNIEKDTCEYMALVNSKFEFLLKSISLIETPYIAWIDAGISKILSNPEDMFNSISKYNIENLDTILIPGAYQKDISFKDLQTNIYWIFLGGFFICAKDIINKFYFSLEETIKKFIQYNSIVWEVNVWVELSKTMKIFEWYKADHNDTMFIIPEKYISNENTKITFLSNKAKEHRLKRENLESYEFARKVLNLEKNPLSLINEELSIVCYYINQKEEGRIACERYLASKADEPVKDNTLNNLQFYINPLKFDKNINIDFKLPYNYFPSSPSIINFNDGYLCNIRAVNYTIRENGSYDVRDSDNIVRTKNFILKLSKDYQINSSYELSDDLGKLNPRFESKVLGLEDVRIFIDKNGNKYFFAVCLETLQHFCPRIVFGSFDESGNLNFIKALNIPNNENNTCEKNWLPFVTETNEICFIYEVSPLTIYSINMETFECQLKVKINQNEFVDHDYRGSSSPIPYKDGWLLTIHQVHYSNPRKYYHRLIWFSNDFSIRKFSSLFIFEKVGIEFNLSICLNENHLLFSYSINDGCSKIATIPIEKIDELLEFSNYLLNNYQEPSEIIKNKKICLCMIVKNESKIIERCLNSCKPILDYISICDTGSTDNTVEIINNFCLKNNIVGKVHNHTWKNFGHNRTLSYVTAKETFPDADYCLLIDADMSLKILPDFDKSRLNAGSYTVAQLGGNLYYFNTRLLSTKYNWKCVGVTHEYWSPENKECITMQLTALEMDDFGDGGSKSDKFERDIKLLTDGLNDEPNNVRYMFYLAQSYHDIGKYEEAIKWYQKRIKIGGWYEEVYYSYYRIAKCKLGCNKSWEEIELAYLDAHKCLPSRMEPLYEIGKYYQYQKKYPEAYKWLKQASTIPFPTNQLLFIFKNIYEFNIWDSLSVVAFYLEKYQETIDACTKALKSPFSKYHTERIQNNMKLSMKKLSPMINFT